MRNGVIRTKSVSISITIGFGIGYGFGVLGATLVTTCAFPELAVGAAVFGVSFLAGIGVDYLSGLAKNWWYGG